jgi:hypothetical protein
MKTKTANEKTEYNLKNIQNFQKIHRVVLRQRSIFHHPNLGIPYPPGPSSANPLSRNLRPISVERRN